jgi:hypothetical protein
MAYLLTDPWIGERVELSLTGALLNYLARHPDVPGEVQVRCAACALELLRIGFDLADDDE